MGSEWKTVPASEFCDSVRDGTHDSPKQVPEGQYLVTSRHITSNRIELQNAYRISCNDFEAINKRSKVDKWDVLITMIGTVGEPCLVYDVPKFAIKNIGLFKSKNELHGKWLYYYLLSPDAQHLIKTYSRGSTQQYIPLGALRELPVTYPSDKKEMSAIAHILGSLDDKIELNRQMNRTLEKMAQAIFKSWFIDFNPVRRNAARAQNQPSPPAPLPEVEGRKNNYRGGFDFSGLVSIARELREKQTPAEEIFWAVVRNRQFMGLKFRRQHQIGEYVADFYCHEQKIVIELDGGVHKTKQKKDDKRDAYMDSLGLTVLRFPNKQIIKEIETVLTQIAEAFPPLLLGEGMGEGVVGSEAFDHLFPDRFEDSELGEIPKGWEVLTVEAGFDVTMGQSPPGSTYNENGDGLPFFQGRRDFGFRYPTKRVYCTEPKRLANVGDTLISVRAPVGDINTAYEHCCVGRGVAAVRHKSRSRSFTYYSMRALGERFSRFEGEGTVFGSINKKQFNTLPYVAPLAGIVEAFENEVGQLDENVRINTEEIRTLSRIRDALLPKLISGELPIPDVEKILEGVK